VAALTTAAAFFLTYRSIRQSELSNGSVDHTQQTLSALIALEGATADLIFASSDQAISRASNSAFTKLDDLLALTAADVRQQMRLQNLRGEIESVVRTRRGGSGSETATRSAATVPQSLSRLMRDIRVEEVALMTRRFAASDSASRRLRRLLVLVAAGSGTLLVWVFGLVVRDERARQRAETGLRRANEELDARVAVRTTELTSR
jgi:CHASE3 domain sensor protein